MKKVFVFLLILLCAVFFSSVSMAEGTKTLQLTKDLSVTIPESAPDFHKFDGQIMGIDRYENGNALAVAEVFNKEQSVFALVILAKIGDTVHVVALQVSYMRDPASPRTEFLEDAEFTKTGIPSNKLSYVSKLTDYEIYKKFVSSTRI